jgi:hypothetical protein
VDVFPSKGESMCIARLWWAPSVGSSRVGFLHLPNDGVEPALETLFSKNYTIM